MQKPRQEYIESEQATAIDERLTIALEENQLLREQLESWCELVESLELELQETQQELEYTNQELCSAIRQDQLEFNQAIELAQTILKRKKSTSESIAQLLSAIYGRAVKLEQVKQIESSSIRTSPSIIAEATKIVANSKEIKTHSQQLRAESKQLGFQFVSLKASFVKLKQNYNDFIKEKREKNKDFNNYLDSNDSNYSSPPPRKKRWIWG